MKRPTVDAEKTANADSSELGLRVELVPQSCWYSNVRDHVAPFEWNRIRKIVFSRHRHRCQICGGIGAEWAVECHEQWHYDDSRFIQRLDDLLSLCPACHEVCHAGLAALRGRHENVISQLQKVNSWTRQQATAHIEEAFRVWEERSAHKWHLDISLLARYNIEPPNSKRAVDRRLQSAAEDDAPASLGDEPF